ncbi:hypothetical protein SteCoe_23784 [Stentor coeruleus]|uniref:Uncharacterized protein n=1 Tax=Stentor coeruleus TaxID=5963 RepID=A0A1R2BJ50_9CILI|nr:hypothetical protein SteCoe_23784 [Stentor coeruleus]
MSVYSGFSTRKLEQDYGNLTSSLISLLNYKVLSSYQGIRVNEKVWINKFLNIHSELAKIEINKHLPPKFSGICDDLVMLLTEGSSIVSHKTPEVSRPVSFLSSSVRFPELSKIRERSVEIKPKKTNSRLKKYRVSMDPSPRRLKSDYYEKALEKYFSLAHHYDKVDEDMMRDIYK